MKEEIHLQKMVDKIVHFDLEKWKESALILSAFEMQAKINGWTAIEIELVVNQAWYEEQEKVLEVLEIYCFKELENIEGLEKEDVFTLLEFLGINHHYLAEKPIDSWDEYDWSNLKSLKRKGTQALKYVHSIHPKTTKVEHKYELPALAIARFDTYQEAKDFIIKERMEEDATIYSHFIYPKDYEKEFK